MEVDEQARPLLEALDDEVRGGPLGDLQCVIASRRGVMEVERYYGGFERDMAWTKEAGTTVLDVVGQPVLFGDEYPSGFQPDQVHNLKSATKSVTSATVGIALEVGLLESLDVSVGDLLPEYFRDRAVDPRKGDISVLDLLRMRSGLRWDENTQVTWDWFNSDDRIGFTLRDQPLDHPPGEHWTYSTADSHLLSACVGAACGEPLGAFAARHLFQKLGFNGWRWEADDQGRTIGGSDLFLTPPDMLKFGQLFLDRGAWQGQEVLPASWVMASHAAQPDVDASVIEAGAGSFHDWPPTIPFYHDGYGYQWWRTTLGGYEAVFAHGWGGQSIVILPELEAVIVTTMSTSWSEAQGTPERKIACFRVQEDYIVPTLAAGKQPQPS